MNFNFAGVLLFFRASNFFQVSNISLGPRHKARGFVLLFCGVVPAGRCKGGDGLFPSASLRTGPSGGARLCGRRRLGMVGRGSHPAEGRRVLLAHREARPEWPPLLPQYGEEAAESSPIGEPFISLFLQ